MNAKKEIRMAIIAITMSFSLMFTSCTKDAYVTPKTSGTPPANEVFIESMSFTPSIITVSAGQTVTWTNKDNTAHTVTSNTPMFDSGSMGNSATFSFTFPTAGTYNYHCSFHSGMTGQVVVQ